MPSKNHKSFNDITLGEIFESFARFFREPTTKKSKPSFKTKMKNEKEIFITKKDLNIFSKQITREVKKYIDKKVDSLTKTPKTPSKISNKKLKEPENIQIPNYETYIKQLQTTHEDLKLEADLLKIKQKNISFKALEKNIYLSLKRNPNSIDKYSYIQLLKFIIRHNVPRVDIDFNDIVCIRNCIKKHFLSDTHEQNNYSVRVRHKASMGGKSQNYYFELRHPSSGDYNRDVSDMFSQNVKDVIMELFEKGGPLNCRISFKANIYWLNQNKTDTIGKTLSNSYSIKFENEINEILQKMVEDVKLCISNSELEGSGWIYLSLNEMMINFRKQTLTTGSSYLPLPSHISQTKGYINVKNTDLNCFKYAIASSQFPASNHAYRPKPYEVHFDKFNFDGLVFPLEIKKSNFEKFEKNNPNLPPLNVFYLENNSSLFPLPFYNSCKGNCNDKSAINLMYFQKDQDSSTGHFVWIKNTSKAFFKLTKHSHRAFICLKCLSTHTSPESLLEHDKFCCLESPAQVLMPNALCKKDCSENCDHKFVRFKKHEAIQEIPVYLVCDSESVCKPYNYCLECKKQIDPNDKEHPKHHSILNEKHESIGYGIYTQVFENYKDAYKDIKDGYVTYTGDNVGRNLLENLIEKSKEIHRVIATTNQKIPKSVYKEWSEKFVKDETECHICNKPIKIIKYRHLDHNHLTGEVRGWTHNVCNLRYTIKNNPIPVLFHNLKSYDSKMFVKELAKIPDIKYSLIAENSEKIKSIMVTVYENKHIVSKFIFIDTLAHLNTSLAKLVDNIKMDESSIPKLRALFPTVSNHFQNDSQFELVLRKGVFPYSWFDNEDKLNYTGVLNQNDFYDNLNKKSISDDDYKLYQKIWYEFEFKEFKEYYSLYLKLDVLLLTDIVIHYKNTCLETYGLDPFWFITSPGLSWNAMLKSTKVELELIQDSTMFHFIKNAIRGGLSYIGVKYAKANNPDIQDYNPELPTSWINYVDFTNLYGHAMTQPLPTGEFKWVYTKKILDPDPNLGRIYCVDLEIPENLHDYLNDFPVAPENLTVGKSNDKKLISHLGSRSNYVVMDELLECYVKLGVKIIKIHNCLQFTKKPFLKEYVKLNADKRKEATSQFAQDFYKLLVNSIYGKMIQDVTKYGNYEIVNSDKYKKLLRQPHLMKNEICLEQCENCSTLGPAVYGDCSKENSCVMCVERLKSRIYVNIPIIVGFCILEISKLQMFKAWYRLKDEYADKIKLCMTDTDSFIYHIETEDNVQHFKKFKDMFDFSNYDPKHPLYNEEHKKIPGYLKNEYPQIPIKSFIGLRSKCYSLKFANNTEKQTAKGIKEKTLLKHQMYNDILINNEDVYLPQTTLRSFKQTIYRFSQEKKALCSNDDKRVWIGKDLEPNSPGWGDTLALNHYKLNSMQLIK